MNFYYFLRGMTELIDSGAELELECGSRRLLVMSKYYEPTPIFDVVIFGGQPERIEVEHRFKDVYLAAALVVAFLFDFVGEVEPAVLDLLMEDWLESLKEDGSL